MVQIMWIDVERYEVECLEGWRKNNWHVVGRADGHRCDVSTGAGTDVRHSVVHHTIMNYVDNLKSFVCTFFNVFFCWPTTKRTLYKTVCLLGSLDLFDSTALLPASAQGLLTPLSFCCWHVQTPLPTLHSLTLL